jgi:Trk K+ transport system NAD-binding subunit
VLAITGRAAPVILPAGDQLLASGDVVALTGTHEAIEAAKGLLLGR